MSEKFFQIYARWVLHRPLLALIALFAVTASMAVGLQHFKIDASADSLTLENDEDLNYYRELVGRYGSSNYLVITYTPREGDLFDDHNLQHLKALRDRLITVKGVTGVLSLLDVPLLYSPKITVADFSGELRQLLSPNVDRQLAKTEFLTSPIYKDTLLSADGQTTGIMLDLELDETFLRLVKERDALRLKRDREGLDDDQSAQLLRVSKEFLDHRTEQTAKSRQMIGEVRSITAEFRDRGTLYLGGPDMITADMVDYLKADLILFGNGILLFIVVTLAVIFRRLQWVVLPLVTCFTSLTIMLGWFSWIDWRLTVISSNFVSLLLIITLALTIHLIVRYRELSSRLTDASQLQLVSETVISLSLIHI